MLNEERPLSDVYKQGVWYFSHGIKMFDSVPRGAFVEPTDNEMLLFYRKNHVYTPDSYKDIIDLSDMISTISLSGLNTNNIFWRELAAAHSEFYCNEVGYPNTFYPKEIDKPSYAGNPYSQFTPFELFSKRNFLFYSTFESVLFDRLRIALVNMSHINISRGFSYWTWGDHRNGNEYYVGELYWKPNENVEVVGTYNTLCKIVRPFVKLWFHSNEDSMRVFDAAATENVFVNKVTGELESSQYVLTSASDRKREKPPVDWYLPFFDYKAYIEKELRAHSTNYKNGNLEAYAQELKDYRKDSWDYRKANQNAPYRAALFFRSIKVIDFQWRFSNPSTK